LGGFVHIVSASIAVLLVALANQQSAAPSLDYETYKTKIQPIFTAKRAGHARCIACHTSGTPLRLQPLAKGSTTWSEDDTKKNFATVSQRAALPGNAKSLLLIHPLEESAGGDFYHSGGKHWSSQNDPEWQTLRAWIMGR
jgi:hypothetical protein